MHSKEETLRRCYGIYLWAYTLSVSGGAVHFDLNEESMEELGVEATFAHHRAAAIGARQPRMVPGDPWSWSRFRSEFEIEKVDMAESKSEEPAVDGASP